MRDEEAQLKAHISLPTEVGLGVGAEGVGAKLTSGADEVPEPPPLPLPNQDLDQRFYFDSLGRQRPVDELGHRSRKPNRPESVDPAMWNATSYEERKCALELRKNGATLTSDGAGAEVAGGDVRSEPVASASSYGVGAKGAGDQYEDAVVSLFFFHFVFSFSLAAACVEEFFVTMRSGVELRQRLMTLRTTLSCSRKVVALIFLLCSRGPASRAE
jgi:hypothetical protein